MNISNPLFAIAVFLIAIATAKILNFFYKTDTDSGRYESIDGLRGFLALSVFIFHANAWFQYINLEKWEIYDSNFYSQLGSVSVAFFFMITSFLFVTKLLNSKGKEFNWKLFFIARFYRLAPMYYVSFLFILLNILFLSNGVLKTDLITFVKSVVSWVFFTIPGAPNLNDYKTTFLINAGVVWSLPFEWLYYFTLPIISLFILRKKTLSIFFSVIFIAVFLFFYKDINIKPYILSFIGGAIAPFLLKYTAKYNFNNKYMSLLSLVLLILIMQFKSSDMLVCKLIAILFFTNIALGNTIFGILKISVFKFLGEISYSTYLIHGIILFMTINWIIGIESIKSYSVMEYWLIIFALSPIVVLLSFLGFNYIEKPFIEKAKLKYIKR